MDEKNKPSTLSTNSSLKSKGKEIKSDFRKQLLTNTSIKPNNKKEFRFFMIKAFSFLILLIITHLSAIGQTFFEVDLPEQADVKLYFVDDENTCDLKVWFVYDTASITGPGLWMEIYEEEKADIKILFMDDPALADMTICMGMGANEAGWLNEDRKVLLEKPNE